MAHFAKLNDNNVVLEVVVVDNNSLDLTNEEESGIAFLTEWSGGYTNWKQTSFNKSFRKNYAGIGYTYDSVRDAFIPPKPEVPDNINITFIFDEGLCDWVNPDAPTKEEIKAMIDAKTLTPKPEGNQ